MPCFLQLRLVVPISPLNCVPNTLLRPLFTYLVDGDHLQPSMIQSNYQISLMKIKSHSFIITNSFSRSRSAGTLQISVNVGESTQIAFKPEVSASLSWNHTIDEDIQIDSASYYLESLGKENDKEIERRRKIGLANKGKAPWNKGRKHSSETRELIKQRTIEALKDPKVRKKMSGGHHPHSEEIKAKIGLGQKKVWRRRFKLKNIREKFYCIWAETIAEAAKRGCCDQEELEWDSYEKLTAEIALQQLQLEANKGKAKIYAKLRAVREKEGRMAKRALQKQEREEKAQSREVKRRRFTKAKQEKQELPISKGLKLKARITTICQKKSVNGRVSSTGDVASSHQPAIENLDLEFIRREKSRRELSLADQIQAAKKKRAESATKEALTKTSSNFILNDRVEQLVSTVYSNRQ